MKALGSYSSLALKKYFLKGRLQRKKLRSLVKYGPFKDSIAYFLLLSNRSISFFVNIRQAPSFSLPSFRCMMRMRFSSITL
jgi:hypothetical protein